MRYEIEIKDRCPRLVGPNSFEIIRWFPSPGGLMVAGLKSTALLTEDNCDLASVKKALAGLVTPA